MSTPIEVSELAGEAKENALKATGLDVVLAGRPEGRTYIEAAHSDRHSFVVMRHCEGEVTVWKMVGGDKQRRKSHMDDVRTTLMENFGGEVA
jgi:hypothetical protein